MPTFSHDALAQLRFELGGKVRCGGGESCRLHCGSPVGEFRSGAAEGLRRTLVGEAIIDTGLFVVESGHAKAALLCLVSRCQKNAVARKHAAIGSGDRRVGPARERSDIEPRSQSPQRGIGAWAGLIRSCRSGARRRQLRRQRATERRGRRLARAASPSLQHGQNGHADRQQTPQMCDPESSGWQALHPLPMPHATDFPQQHMGKFAVACSPATMGSGVTHSQGAG